MRPLLEELKHLIKIKGQISFKKFMELALYWPPDGYYSSLTTTNRIKDFITSPKTHPLFATMICKQIQNATEKIIYFMRS